MNQLVIQPPWGGLGDHLFHTHLPRIARHLGQHDHVALSSKSTFRSPDYRSLIWERNPHLSSFSGERTTNCASVRNLAGQNILDQIMLAHGLDDGIRFHEPEVYFEPKSKPELSKLTVYDPNFVSFVGSVRPVDVQRFFTSRDIFPDLMMLPRGRSVPVTRYGRLLAATSLAEYSSIITSAKQFICLTSGGATLASALGTSALALWGTGQNPVFHHSARHTYVNVTPPSFGNSKVGCQRLVQQSLSRLHRLVDDQ